jgi:acetyl esterase
MNSLNGRQSASLEDLAYAAESRAVYRAMSANAGAPDPVAAVQEILIPADSPARLIPARLYVPIGTAGANPRPVVLYLHGGGFISGDLDTHDVMIRALANRSGALVLSLDWRLAPEHPFPAGLEDAFAALQWLAVRGAKIGADGRRIAIAGDSAGGALAASLAIVARVRGGPSIAGQILYYANVGNAIDTRSWSQFGDTHFPTRDVMTRVLQLYVPEGGERLQDPLVAPLRGDLHGLPSALVITGEMDPLKDEGRAYAEKLNASGGFAKLIEYKGVAHGFVQFFKDPSNGPHGDNALNESADFLKKVL